MEEPIKSRATLSLEELPIMWCTIYFTFLPFHARSCF